MPIGTHTITGSYSGSPAHLPSTATAQVVVQGIATTTAMTIGKTVVKAGKPLSVSVTVDSVGSSLPTGMVRLFDGVEPVGCRDAQQREGDHRVDTRRQGPAQPHRPVCRRRPAVASQSGSVVVRVS